MREVIWLMEVFIFTILLMKKFLSLQLVTLPFFVSAQFPEQDCSGALFISSSTDTLHGYTGWGLFNEILYPHNTSCLISSEENSVWLKFSVCDSGVLIFEIIPLLNGDDFDFSLYDFTGLTCEEALDSTTHLIRCNFSAVPGPTGCSSIGTLNSVSAGGPNQCAAVNAFQDEQFLLLINNHSGDSIGFIMNFYSDAMDSCIFLTSISDVIPLEFSIYPNPAPRQVILNFPSLVESFSLYSINGKLLRLFNHVHQSKFDLDVSDLSSGMYFITASSGNKIYRGKILVEH